MRTILIGMGNPILCDDSVGIRLVQDFKEKLGNIPGLDILEECSVGGLNLLDLLVGYERAIIVDSIKTQGGKPGDWYYFTAERLRETMNLTNVHDANFFTSLELGSRLGMAVPAPPDTHIFAVEIVENLTFSEQMSELVEQAYPVFSKEIFPGICELLRIPGSAAGNIL